MAGCQDVIVIDGGMLEGGGQILRNSAALSCLLGQPVTINNIRAGRSNPGLRLITFPLQSTEVSGAEGVVVGTGTTDMNHRPQHLMGLQLIRDVCGGKLTGDRVGSTEITFHPGPIKGGSYQADTKTAGSICLLMQAAMPCLLYGDGESVLSLRGGTNAEMAPQVDYTIMVFNPIAEEFGMKSDCDIRRRGYYPKGGGEVKITSYPMKKLKPVSMTTRGEVTKVTIRSFVAGVLPIKVADIMARCAIDTIQQVYNDVAINKDVVKEPGHAAVGTGTGIIIVAETSTGCLLAGSALGKKGVPAEKVGTDAAQMLLDNLAHGGCVDDYLQDQLILLMALAEGKSEVLCGPITLHTQTAIHVAQLLTKAKFEIKKLSDNSNVIECEGIGLVNSRLP